MIFLFQHDQGIRGESATLGGLVHAHLIDPTERPTAAAQS
jgi:hypothetical protein